MCFFSAAVSSLWGVRLLLVSGDRRPAPVGETRVLLCAALRAHVRAQGPVRPSECPRPGPETPQSWCSRTGLGLPLSVLSHVAFLIGSEH